MGHSDTENFYNHHLDAGIHHRFEEFCKRNQGTDAWKWGSGVTPFFLDDKLREGQEYALRSRHPEGTGKRNLILGDRNALQGALQSIAERRYGLRSEIVLVFGGAKTDYSLGMFGFDNGEVKGSPSRNVSDKIKLSDLERIAHRTIEIVRKTGKKHISGVEHGRTIPRRQNDELIQEAWINEGTIFTLPDKDESKRTELKVESDAQLLTFLGQIATLEASKYRGAKLSVRVVDGDYAIQEDFDPEVYSAYRAWTKGGKQGAHKLTPRVINALAIAKIASPEELKKIPEEELRGRLKEHHIGGLDIRAVLKEVRSMIC